MTLTQMLSFVRRRFWLVIAGAAVAGVVAAVLSLVWPPTYEAEALLLITKLRSSVTLDSRFQTVAEENVVNLSIQEDQVRRQTLVGLAENPDLLLQVIARLGEVLPPRQQTVTHIQGAIDVRTEGNLIAFVARAETPSKAAAIANAWAQAYQAHVNRLYSATAPSDLQIQPELETAQNDYEEAKQAVSAFLRQNQENELGRQIDQKQQILADLQKGQLAAARVRVDALLSRINRYDQVLLDAQSLTKQLGTSTSPRLTPGQQLALFMLEGLSFGQVALDQATSGGGAGSPVVLEIGPGSLDLPDLTTEEAIEHLTDLIDTLHTARAAALAEVESLSLDLLSGRDLLTYGSGEASGTRIAQLQQEIDDLQAKLHEQELTKQDLTNTRDIAQQNYLTLLRKAAEIRIASQLTSVEVQIAADAQPPEAPAFPSPLIATVLGVIAGGLAGLVLAFLVEFWPRGAGNGQPTRR